MNAHSYCFADLLQRAFGEGGVAVEWYETHFYLDTVYKVLQVQWYTEDVRYRHQTLC